MSYIKENDIKSSLAEGFNLQPYIEEADYELEDMAERVGIRDTDRIKTPIHFKAKRYLVEYILMRLSEDKTGVNNPDSIQFDKYFALAEYHRRRANELRTELSYEMLAGEIDEIRDRALDTATIFRG